jgi:uncharacterized repeat protein (TIGR01451 family)
MNNKKIAIAARALAIGMVAVLVLMGTANAYVIDTKENELVARNIFVPFTTATPTVLLSSAITGDKYILEISGYGSLDVGNYNAGNADYEWRELGPNGQWGGNSKRFAPSDAPRINGQHISPIDSSFNPNHVYYVELIPEKSVIELYFYDSLYSDNSGSFNVNVYHKLSALKQPSLTLTKSLSPSTITEGDSTTVTIRVENTGGDAKSVKITDAIPQGFTIVSGSASQEYATLKATESRTFQYTIKATGTGRFVSDLATVAYQDDKGNSYSGASNSATITVQAGQAGQVPAAQPKTPGFGAILAGIGIILALALRRR